MPADSDDFERDTFEVEIEGVEDRFRGIFQSYKINSNYMTPTDAWEFVVFSEEEQFNLRRIWRPLQPVKLFINGACQVIGRIDGIEGVPHSGAALRVFGRDYLADLVDATADPQFVVQKGWTVEQALLELFRPFGITEIRTSNFDAMVVLVGSSGSAAIKKGKATKSKRAHDVQLSDYKVEDNLGVMEFAHRILARHGFLVLPASDRNAVTVDSPNYDQEPLCQFTRPGNILEAVAKRDWSNVPTVTSARGRTGEPNSSVPGGRSEFPTFTGPNAPSKIGKNEEVRRILERSDSVGAVIEDRYDLKSHAIPLPGTLYRPLFYRDRDSRNQEQLEHAVRRMIAERLRDTLTYDVTMRGHTEPDSGVIYTVDTLADVSDTLEDLHERLWCFERTLENDGSSPRTNLKYIRPESYVLNIEDLPSATAAGAVKIAVPKPAIATNSGSAAARAAAAERFVAENFHDIQGPTDLLEGLRGR